MKEKTPNSRFTTRDVALVCVFAPLYLLFSFWTFFPIIGYEGKFITMAAVMAPLIGIILGPYRGTIAVALGGIVGAAIAQTGSFNPISFMPGIAAAFCSGFLYNRKRHVPALLYLVLLFTLAFYPTIGPAWLYPYFVWLQLAGLITLISPLQSKAVKFTRNNENLPKLTLGVGVICFTATLFAHVVGCLTFEITHWPTIYPELSYWQSTWPFLTFLYPIERVTITVIATFIGAPLIKALHTMVKVI